MIDEELNGVRERMAWMTIRMQEQADEIAELKQLVAVLQDNCDLLAGLYERHQHHHEAVEELLGRPIGHAVVQRLLTDIHLRDEQKRREDREQQVKVIDATFISESVVRV